MLSPLSHQPQHHRMQRPSQKALLMVRMTTSHLGCVNKQMRGEEQEWQVGADEPKGVAGHMASEEDPSAVEEVGDIPVEDLEGKSSDLPPRSP